MRISASSNSDGQAVERPGAVFLDRQPMAGPVVLVSDRVVLDDLCRARSRADRQVQGRSLTRLAIGGIHEI